MTVRSSIRPVAPRATTDPATDAATDPDVGALPPEPVTRPMMLQRWECLSFLHWPLEPSAVARRLPPGLTVDTFEGSAWVGLVPFRLTVRGPDAPRLPWASTFLETNVRTYVLGPDGRRGIWFFSLDAARLGAVVVARRAYRLPYVWSRMTLRDDGDAIRYTGRRRGPSLPPAAYRIRVSARRRVDPPDLTPLERFLTCRWRLYAPSAGLGGFDVTRVEHAAWSLWRGHAALVQETLLAAAGLVRPPVEAIVHVSPGLDVRLSRRRLAGSAAWSPGSEGA